MFKPAFDYPALARERLLTFQVLIELFVVRQFRQAGWSLPRIREEGRTAAHQFQTDHPFATRRVLTQERYGFVSPVLQNLEFEGEEAGAYRPLGKEQRVIIDRARAFGAPQEGQSDPRRRSGGICPTPGEQQDQRC